MDLAQELLETRRQEALALLSAERAALAIGSQALYVGIFVAGAAAAYGVGGHHKEVLLALPPVLLLVVAYALQVFGDVAAMGAARTYLESEINKKLEAPAIVYDTVVAPTRSEPIDKSQYAGKVFLGLLLLLISAACLAWAPTPKPHGALLRDAAYAVTVAGAIWVVAATCTLFRTADLVRVKLDHLKETLEREGAESKRTPRGG